MTGPAGQLQAHVASVRRGRFFRHRGTASDALINTLQQQAAQDS
jgi:hypothetical protein